MHPTQVEGIEIEEEALAHLGGVSEATSLRHAVQLLTPASALAATHGRDGVNRADLEEVPPPSQIPHTTSSSGG